MPESKAYKQAIKRARKEQEKQKKAERAEKKRQKYLEKLRKRTEVLKAKGDERKALARAREEARHARHVSAPRYILGGLDRATRKTDKSLAKSVTRKRKKKSPIRWL